LLFTVNEKNADLAYFGTHHSTALARARVRARLGARIRA